MSFDTISFWVIFIPLVLIYSLLPSRILRNTLLLTTSYGIYASWDWRFLPIIMISTIVDYLVGISITRAKTPFIKKLALSLSLGVNLGLLFTFKYLLAILGPTPGDTMGAFSSFLQNIGLPLGISFYTFQTLSYTLDVYRGKIKATTNFIDFALYVSFFPQLTAGPIEKARRFLPQIQRDRLVTGKDRREGFVLIVLGLVKKTYVADSLIVAVNFIFEYSTGHQTSLVIMSSILMTFCVYADFSGYSDMARGMAKFFGINLVQNYKPFWHSTSPEKFWRRWHISFMEWVRDYLVIPFHYPKRPWWITNLHIILVMVIVGVWHGASWNWFFFGLIHGVALVLSRSWNIFRRKYGLSLSSFFTIPFGLLFMFTLYFFSGLLHASKDLSQVSTLLISLTSLSGFHYEAIDYLLYIFQFFGPLLIYEIIVLLKKDEFFVLKLPWPLQALLVAIALSFITIFERVSKSGFIYFNF